MSTEVEATATATSDPLKHVAEAMKSAANSGMDDNSPGGRGAAGANQAEEALLSRVAYSSGYYLSYGVVFPTLFVVNVIPGGSAMVSGIVDGAKAANDYVHGLRGTASKLMMTLSGSRFVAEVVRLRDSPASQLSPNSHEFGYGTRGPVDLALAV